MPGVLWTVSQHLRLARLPAMLIPHSKLGHALNSTKKPIKLQNPDRKLRELITASEAASLMACGLYEVGGSSNRVKWIRPIGPQPQCRQFPVDMAYWDGRAVLRFWPDQCSAQGVVVA